MRRAPAGLLLAALTLLPCCTGEPAPPEPVSPPSSTTHGTTPTMRLVEVEAPGLDVVQIGGGPDVDTIIESLGCGGAWLDYDGDGDPDLYLAQGALPADPRSGPPDRLLRNDGDPDGDGVPSFTDVTAAAGLGDRRWSVGAAVADYDNDGDPDLHLTNWGPDRLYRNNGDGTFTDVAEAAGVDDAGYSGSSVWSDVDGDGDLDLYVTRYVVFEFGRYPSRGEPKRGGGPPCVWRNLEVFCGPRGLEPQADLFYRNDGDDDGDGVPSFVESAAAVGLIPDEAYFGLAAHFFDADDDGDDDLYVANDSVQNTFFANRGDGVFQESSILAGLAYNEQGNEQAGMGIASGDLNGDGRVDLVVTNFSHDHDTFYRNDGDQMFTDISYPAGIGSPSFLTLSWGVSAVDLNLDGWEDLYVAHGHVYPQVDGAELGTSFRQPNALFLNGGDGLFEPSGDAGDGLATAQSSRAVLPVDLDADGDLDLLITNLNAPPDLLRNDATGGRWLQVRLQGVQSNRDGEGARIRATAGGRTQTRQIRRATGFAGSTLPIAHFGFGNAERVERLEIRWPSGRTTTLQDVALDQRLVVTESGSDDGDGSYRPSR